MEWVTPASISALAAVLWWLGRRVLTQLDELKEMVSTELRALDVRIVRLESHLWPDRMP